MDKLSKDVIELEEVLKNARMGSVIPAAWYSHLRHKDGRFKGQSYLEAIVLLADIVYWHRPSKRNTKRFAGKQLQRSQAEMAEVYGFKKRAVYDALKYLEEEGFIRKTISTNARGTATYFDLMIDKIIEISCEEIAE